MPSFRRTRGGGLTAVLEPGEAQLLQTLPEQLRELVRQPEGAVHDRFFPRAYLDPTEEAAETEWQRLMHADLVEGKVEALEVFESTLQRRREEHGAVAVDLEADEVAAWLGALNDARLALGVMLEVSEELDIERLSPDDPRAPGLHLYAWLTWLQGELIEALDAT